MKLRKADESEVVYFDEQGDVLEREAVLQQVKGLSLVESKNVMSGYEKTTSRGWKDRQGNVLATTYGDIVTAVEIKPVDADQRRMELLQQMREALDSGDILESQRLQLEYHELMAVLDD